MSAKVKDIFSMLKGTELPLSIIEKYFLDDYDGSIVPNGYTVIREDIPTDLIMLRQICRL